MPRLLSVVGVLVICAGLDLLWQSRREIRFWFSAYVRFFRAMLRQQELSPALLANEKRGNRRGAMRFLLGMGFAFFLGPMLIALALTLMYTNF